MYAREGAFRKCSPMPCRLLWTLSFASDELKEVHKYLIELTAVGAISRQEAVSMLPPFLLNVQPHHAVCIAVLGKHACRRCLAHTARRVGVLCQSVVEFIAQFGRTLRTRDMLVLHPTVTAGDGHVCIPWLQDSPTAGGIASGRWAGKAAESSRRISILGILFGGPMLASFACML